jgi:acetylglutamate kinase
VRILIKLGGTLLDVPESRHRLAREIAAVAKTAHSVVVVHGGGKQMTRYLAEKGIESKFVDGLRVTTVDVLDAVLKVLAGSVNQELVAAFIAAGASAVGLSGVDALLAEAEQMSPALGFVGRTVHSDGRLLELLTGHGYLPVVACVAGDRKGQIYNVNADQMAVACAAGFQTDRLLFLTDVDGVRGASNETLPLLTPEQCRELIASGVATGGMQAKLNAATDALDRGVGEVVIAPGALTGIVQKLMAGEAVGTRLIAAAGVAP